MAGTKMAQLEVVWLINRAVEPGTCSDSREVSDVIVEELVTS